VGDGMGAWSVDPTVAEIGWGTVMEVNERTAKVRFLVTAHRLGATQFIIGTVGYSIYEAAVAGRIETSPFRRGDSNGDGKGDISDAIHTLSALFSGTAHLACLDAADCDDDGQVNITDPIFWLGLLFSAGKAPPAPGPSTCGEDPTPDAEDCEDFPHCSDP